MAQISTAISDLALAVSCAVAIGYLNTERSNFSYAKLSFASMMLAATLGVIRFGMDKPPNVIVKAHNWASKMASSVGLCLLACEFYQQGHLPVIGFIQIFASVAVALLWPFVDSKTHDVMSNFTGSMAVVSILLFCIVHKDLLGCVGVFLVIMAGTVVGTRGSRIGVPAVDIFHYLLALSLYFQVWSLVSDRV